MGIIIIISSKYLLAVVIICHQNVQITIQQHVYNMKKKHVFIKILKESNQTLEIGIEALSIF